MREIIRYGATWCQPCHKLDPILDELEAEGIKVTKIDLDKEPHSSAGYNIQSVPTMIFFNDGIEVNSIVGVKTKQQILEVFDK